MGPGRLVAWARATGSRPGAGAQMVDVARSRREQKSAHPPLIGGVQTICAAQRALRHAPPANRGGAHDLCRPAGPHARTPRNRGGWAGFVPLTRRRCLPSCSAGGWGRWVRRAGSEARLGPAGPARRDPTYAMWSPQCQIADRFGCMTPQSRAQKTRLGCCPATSWGTPRPPKMGHLQVFLGSCDVSPG
jgi:hypothetical protein